MGHVGKFAIVISVCSASELDNAKRSSKGGNTRIADHLVEDIQINRCCTENA
jgi:hypothetical protein